jgi:hypothetical protein
MRNSVAVVAVVALVVVVRMRPGCSNGQHFATISTNVVA